MAPSFPILRDLAMRAVLLNEIPWEEEDESLPMVKEMEALRRLPGEYTITESSIVVTKAGGGALSPQEAAIAEKMKKAWSLKKGGKISIAKEMDGDPIVLWNIDEDRESGRNGFAILTQPVHHGCNLGRDGKMLARKVTTLISGVKVEEGENYKAKVERKWHITREEKVLQSGSICWELDRRGKLEVVRKEWWTLPAGVELELINNGLALRD